jgi:hypothetical protein
MPQSEAADRVPYGPAPAAEPDCPDPARSGPSCAELSAADAAGLDAAEAESGSAVVATWPATSRTRLPAGVLYVDVKPEATRRPPA